MTVLTTAQFKAYLRFYSYRAAAEASRAIEAHRARVGAVHLNRPRNFPVSSGAIEVNHPYLIKDGGGEMIKPVLP
jgi:hypothetical protein